MHSALSNSVTYMSCFLKHNAHKHNQAREGRKNINTYSEPYCYIHQFYISIFINEYAHSDEFHISRRKNVNWMWKLALLRDRSIWHRAWMDNLGVNQIFRHIWAWFVRKKISESGISSPLWGIVVNSPAFCGRETPAFWGVENVFL